MNGANPTIPLVVAQWHMLEQQWSGVKAAMTMHVGKPTGIRKKAGVHTLRHTFGAHKADKNMSLATLQELMGHKKKETTLKYIHLAKTNLRQEMVQTAL